jgi:hypothetical protein
LRLIFDLYDQGRTIAQVSEELFRRGVPSPAGTPRWSRVAVHRVLTDRTYLGDKPWGVHPEGKRWRFRGGAVTETARGDSANQTNHEPLVVEDTHEPLVTREQFGRVRARLAGNRTGRMAKGQEPGKAGRFLLSRLLVCGHCGSLMLGVTRCGRREYLCGGHARYGKTHCHRNTVHEKTLVDFLIATLRQTFLDPENLAELRREMTGRQAADRCEANLRRLKGCVATLDKKIGQATERLALIDLENLADYQGQIKRWRAEREAAQEELRRAETESPVADLEERIALAEKALWELEEALSRDDELRLRQVFLQLVAKVEVHFAHTTPKRRVVCRFDRGILHLRHDEELLLLLPAGCRL